MLNDTASSTLIWNPMTHKEEDWSFEELSTIETLWGPHGYHRYPAKFIPQLVRRVIDNYSLQNEYVGDIFVGSGTTGIEAIRAGRNFYGSDINPIACLVSRAKCIPIEPSEAQYSWDKLSEQVTELTTLKRRPLSTKDKVAILSIDINRASPEERLLYWFPEAQRNVLKQVLEAILQTCGEQHKIFMLCAFSNILKRCSIWLSGSTKAQKDMTKVLADPAEEFVKQVRDMLKRNRLYWEDLQESGIDPRFVADRIRIDREDARGLAINNIQFDLLVTSPPYATCYEYSELHQLTQLWFEKYTIVEPTVPKWNWIGSKTGTNPSADTNVISSAAANEALEKLEQVAKLQKERQSDILREIRALQRYFADMHQAVCEMARVVKSGKRMVLIIGDSRRRNVDIPTTQAMIEMSYSSGFNLEERIKRKVPGRVLVSTRDRRTGRFSSTASSDAQVYPEEDILVFKRQ